MTTELEAVNSLLATIGEAPVSSFGSPIAPDASRALETIREVTRTTLSRGWWFNTEVNTTLVPDSVSKEVTLPVAILSVSFGPQGNYVDPINRGQRVYDRANKTYAFNQSVTVRRLIINLLWDELPETAKSYIRIKASRLFRTRTFVSVIGPAYDVADETQASAELMSEHYRNSPTNIYNTDGVYQGGLNRNNNASF